MLYITIDSLGSPYDTMHSPIVQCTILRCSEFKALAIYVAIDYSNEFSPYKITMI